MFSHGKRMLFHEYSENGKDRMPAGWTPFEKASSVELVERELMSHSLGGTATLQQHDKVEIG